MSTAPIDLLLSRLDKPRKSGPDRWRCACPVCGGKNRSTLSVGVGERGAVLVQCFKDRCGFDEIAAVLGLAVQDLLTPRESFGRSLTRRRLLSPQQALDLLDAEANLIFVTAGNIAHGVAITDVDRARCLASAARIAWLREEAMS